MKLNLGFLGAGTVGTGAIRGLYKSLGQFKETHGIELIIKEVVSKNPEKYFFSYPHSADIGSVIGNPSIGIVVSLIGGIKEYEPIRKALENGKHVITANKAVIDAYGVELNQLAIDNNAHLAFEGSVAGGIPIINGIKKGMIGNDTTGIYGIINGTTNFMLYHMLKDGWSYEAALKKAQEKGFAEADPSFDVNGPDAAQKLAILYSIAFERKVTQSQIFTQGIRKITADDIKYASELGYVIKLLAIAKHRNGKAELRVHPTMIPLDHRLASVEEEKNSVLLEGLANISFTGEGAGMYPTGSSVVSDIKNVALMIKNGQPPIKYFYDNPVQILSIDDVLSQFYLRLNAVDKPGVTGKLGAILSNEEISICEQIQRKRKKGHSVPIVITTHPTTYRQIKKAMLNFSPDTIKVESMIFVGLEEHLDDTIEIFVQEQYKGIVDKILGSPQYELYKRNILKFIITSGSLGELKPYFNLGPIKKYVNKKDPERIEHPFLEIEEGGKKVLVSSMNKEEVHSWGGTTRDEREKIIRYETEKNPKSPYFDPVVEISRSLERVRTEQGISKPVLLYFKK